MACIDLAPIADFFNNQSVGAFLGAFAAFMLVVANDQRRERRKIVTLRAEIETNRAHAETKLETARGMRALIREHNRVRPSPILRFNTQFTRQLTAEILHHLSLDQRRAVEGLCYAMEAIDGLLEETHNLARRFIGPMDHAERIPTSELLLVNWADIIANLNRLLEMCDLYLAGKFSELVSKEYDPAAYEEA